MRLLFIPTFVESDRAGLAESSSDSVGYGITSAGALVRAFTELGCDVAVPRCAETDSVAWVPAILSAVYKHLRDSEFDAILCFHAFTPFAGDIRRMMDALELRIPLAAYTHGSHWDPTDTFRSQRYPQLRWADLGNLLAADQVLAPSEYLKRTISDQVALASPSAAAELSERMHVVGMPVDLSRITRSRRDRDTERPLIVFNHAMHSAKRPEVFLRALPRLFAASDCRAVLTRAGPHSSPYLETLERLKRDFPDRLMTADHLPIDSYYELLWQASVQISTAEHEGFGVATLEAMACHNYCCVPDVGAYRELVGPITDSIYADEEGLLKMATRALQFEEVRSRNAHALAERALHFTPSVIARQILGVIAERRPVGHENAIGR